MLKNKNLKIVVSGSLAYDSIMDFPGDFVDHILPEQVHNLNLSFTLSGLKTSFGGTAGNIAYNLSLLGEKPTILGVVGSDFASYATWLKKNKIDISRIGIDKKDKTAAAQIITDRHDNQITGFYPGPLLSGYASRAQGLKNIFLAIISPEHVSRMMGYAKIYQHKNIPYIFDPGQMVPALSSLQLRQAIKGAQILIGNDYEIQLILNKLKLTLVSLLEIIKVVIVTKGEKGSEIYQGEQKIKIKSAIPKKIIDPTGAGDAYRAGLIKGLVNGYNLKTCGQLASLVAVYAVEQQGTQEHKFSLTDLQKRYRQNYQEKLVLN